eukprot:s157_g30.t1
MQEAPNDAVPGAAGEDDADAFRKMQSRRKARGVEYLSNPLSPFHLMTSLTLAMVLAPVTNKIFQLSESDRKGISRQEPVRLKRRLRAKGPESFAAEQPPKFENIKALAVQATERLWSEILKEPKIFTVAGVFFPDGEPIQNKWISLLENILRNIAALKWRLLSRFACPPWSLCSLEAPDCADQVNQAQASFLAESSCCLDPFWSAPVQEKVKAAQLDFKETAQEFWKPFRCNSLREEQAHRIQRFFAGGDHAKARLASNQRALSVIHAVKTNFESRGGRRLDSARPIVISKFAKASRKKHRFKRPKQAGNAMFFFIGHHLKEPGADRKELVRRWHSLSAEGKLWWKSKHSTSVGIKRSRTAQETSWKEKELSGTNLEQANTSWNLGTADFPLDPQRLQPFLAKFQGKAAGLHALSQIENVDVQQYVDAVTSNKVVYHSKDATKLACDAYFGGELNEDSVKICELTGEIMATPVPGLGCHTMHPGFCATKHGGQKAALASVFKILPKKSCIIQFKSNRLVLYVRTKRPLRMFYLPLEMDAEPVPECWFAYRRSQAKQLKLQRVPGGIDWGGCGMYNHHEFILKLLSVQPADAWEIAECTYNQCSLRDITITGIAERLGRPGQVPAQPAAAPASSSAAQSPQEEMDWSIFEDPALSSRRAAAGFSFPDMSGVPDVDGEANMFFAGEDEEDLFLDREVQSDFETETALAPHLESEKQPDSEAESAKSAGTHGSAASGGMKTASTDTDLLKQVLGSRPDGLLFRFSSPEQYQISVSGASGAILLAIWLF